MDSDWSDSDEEQVSEVETAVLLGVPDGSITDSTDLHDAAVSRIGGHPAFLPTTEPPFSSSSCKICSNPMELLMQLWCPFENSPMDRALYIWGCGRAGCQAKPGSVRAWRGLRFNEKYAAKLEKKLAAQTNKNAVKPNPFSMATSPAPGPFGLGAQVFGDASSSSSPGDQDEESDNESTSSDQSLLTAMASATLEESSWKTAPEHPAFYLSTVSEYLPAQPKLKIPEGVTVGDSSLEGNDKDISWAFEPYENSLEVDQVFARFTKRVGYEGQQCIRYELKGTPLPFSSDKTFELLFPCPPSTVVVVSKAGSKVENNAPKRTYNLSKITPCPVCKSRRVFECQIMPNLINVIRNDHMDHFKGLNDDARRQAIQKALKGGDGDKSEKRGMEWGTCMIFSCEKDCRIDDKGAEVLEVWREEVVLIQGDVY